MDFLPLPYAHGWHLFRAYWSLMELYEDTCGSCCKAPRINLLPLAIERDECARACVYVAILTERVGLPNFDHASWVSLCVKEEVECPRSEAVFFYALPRSMGRTGKRLGGEVRLVCFNDATAGNVGVEFMI